VLIYRRSNNLTTLEMSIKTILVPYDFSECANDALQVASKIARLSGACIDVVHLYEQMTDFHTENQRIREEIEAKLDRVPDLPFVQGVELRKFMLRQMSLSDMFKNERLAAVDLIVM
jgi:nucleotide-binding universal stress UspA family protein